MAEQQTQYGARVYRLANNRALIKQTRKSGHDQNSDYVVDEHREKHVDLTDDAQVAQAVRDALDGKLSN